MEYFLQGGDELLWSHCSGVEQRVKMEELAGIV